MREHRVGDAGQFPGDPDVEAGDIAKMAHIAAAQYCPAGQSDPVSARNRNEALAQLLFHRIKRMIADQVKHPVAVLPVGPVSLGFRGQASGSIYKGIAAFIVDLKRAAFPYTNLLHPVQQLERKTGKRGSHFFGK
ncbi:hypothetical protein D3C71_1459280 [compost metagenome]